MRTLQNYLDSLALNYLNNTSLVSEKTGSVRESAVTTCIAAINAGMLSIYSRVTLQVKEVYIEPVTGITQYDLKKIHTYRAKEEYDLENDPDDVDYVPYPYPVYIRETADLLEDDILTIKDIKTNDTIIYPPKVSATSFIIDWDSYKAASISVSYRSRGLAIPYDATGDYIVDCPDIAVTAIECFAAQQILLSIGTETANYTARQYVAKYEQAILYLSENILTDDQQYAEGKFNSAGWV